MDLDAVAAQDLQGFLQRLDLFLAASHTILVALASVDACWLELVVVCKRGIKLLLGSMQFLLFLNEGLLLVLLLIRLVLNISCLLSLVGCRVCHELVVLLLGTCLSSLR